VARFRVRGYGADTGTATGFSGMSLVEDMLAELSGMDPKSLAGLDKAFRAQKLVWFPNPGPQLEAYESPADELFYGGSAGGG